MRSGPKDEQQDQSLARRVLDPELVLYFIAGAVVISLGLVALARWIAEQWASGARASVAIASLGAAAALAVAAFGLRRRRPILVLACVLAWIGGIAYVLATFGFSLPRFWSG
jgi:hypothetical protein